MDNKGDGCDIHHLDYSKVFETVPHEKLLKMLVAVGIIGKILHCIGNCLHNREQRVVIEGACHS